jgi:alpha-D-xyloside xylohydrolase
MTLDEIPMFVKDNSILPFAEPVEFVTPSTIFKISCKVYGNPKDEVKLFEDNSYNFNYEKGDYNWVKLSWNGKEGKASRLGNYNKQIYQVDNWKQVGN